MLYRSYTIITDISQKKVHLFPSQKKVRLFPSQKKVCLFPEGLSEALNRARREVSIILSIKMHLRDLLE